VPYTNANSITSTNAGLIRRASLVIIVICETTTVSQRTRRSSKSASLKALVYEKPLVIIISKSQDVLQALNSFLAIIRCKDYSRGTMNARAGDAFIGNV
jgi:hypothetical protein